MNVEGGNGFQSKLEFFFLIFVEISCAAAAAATEFFMSRILLSNFVKKKKKNSICCCAVFFWSLENVMKKNGTKCEKFFWQFKFGTHTHTVHVEFGSKQTQFERCLFGV